MVAAAAGLAVAAALVGDLAAGVVAAAAVRQPRSAG
jgi:hypothetical protein